LYVAVSDPTTVEFALKQFYLASQLKTFRVVQ